jgi:acyl dehydratase
MGAVLPPTRTPSSLLAGQALPTLTRTIDLVSMVAYAGATWDWHRMHYDRAFVEDAGFGAPVVDGQVLGALLAEVLQDGLGPRARLRTLDFRFRAMVFAEETVTCTATCTGIDGDLAGFDLEVTATDAHGATRQAVTGTATVWLPDEDADASTGGGTAADSPGPDDESEVGHA